MRINYLPHMHGMREAIFTSLTPLQKAIMAIALTVIAGCLACGLALYYNNKYHEEKNSWWGSEPLEYLSKPFLRGAALKKTPEITEFQSRNKITLINHTNEKIEFA